MTRPKKTIPPAKECQITIRMTQDLFDVLTKDAKDAGLPRTEYIRHIITGRTPAVKYEIVFNNPKILKIFANLANITGNLNQIAHHLNAGLGWADELRREVYEAIYEVREMRKELKELAGEYRGDC